jgi:hypothetical protein
VFDHEHNNTVDVREIGTIIRSLGQSEKIQRKKCYNFITKDRCYDFKICQVFPKLLLFRQEKDIITFIFKKTLTPEARYFF